MIPMISDFTITRTHRISCTISLCDESRRGMAERRGRCLLLLRPVSSQTVLPYTYRFQVTFSSLYPFCLRFSLRRSLSISLWPSLRVLSFLSSSLSTPSNLHLNHYHPPVSFSSSQDPFDRLIFFSPSQRIASRSPKRKTEGGSEGEKAKRERGETSKR